VLLTYLITAALIAASLVLATATASHAAPGNHRPATWNMQGAGTGKWSWVAKLSDGGAYGRNFVDSHDVIALQEAGSLDSLPRGATQLESTTLATHSTMWDVAVYEWGSRYITFLWCDLTGNRTNIALVTHERPNLSRVHLMHSRLENGGVPRRPALGIELSDGSVFYSVHASSNGNRTTNEVDNLLDDIAQRHNQTGRRWAALGDFNRDPHLVRVPQSAGLYRTGHATHTGSRGGELDYMVSNDTQNLAGWTGRTLGGGGSDHMSVEFAFRANAQRHNILHKDGGVGRVGQNSCLTFDPFVAGGDFNAHVDGDPNLVRCENDPDKAHFFDFDFSGESIKSDPLCLDVDYEGTANGSGVGAYPCNGQSNQRWERTSSGLIKGVESGRCFATGVSSHRWFEIRDCNANDPAQQFIIPQFAPYVWDMSTSSWDGTPDDAERNDGTPLSDPLSSSSGTAGTSNNGTSTGSSGDPSESDSGSCPMPPHPVLDPCHHISKRSTTDVDIPDNSTVHSPISVTDIGGSAPSTLGVGVDIKHTYRGDLHLSLLAPDGTSYHLEDIPNNDDGDHVYTSYTVDASSETANGTWRLQVRDTGSGDTGYIDAWNLTFPNGSDSGGSGGTSSGGSSGGSTSGGTGDFENTDDVAIRDHSTAESRISVIGMRGNAPSNLTVGVDIKHSFRGDLRVSLVGPDGREWLLEDPIGPGTDLNTTYTVDASSQRADGLWRLRVEDTSNGDEGKIDSWYLTFGDEPVQTQPWPPAGDGSGSNGGSGSGSGGGSEPCLTPSGSPC
ncbi:proprotein convertase P-domain-containing protein, partial [Streptomyces sp. NPDC006984]|uniref:proprotein convertase P-domain-containing protein n=1 Tax=Streptomyces sp. NPDC006984 TaxID=3155463 RepID=UPI0033F12A5F